MKKSTLSQPIARTPASILLIGPPGTGKTTLALQFPNVWLANADNNLGGPEAWLRNEKKFRDYSYDNVAFTDNGTPLPAHEVFDNLMDRLKAAIADPEIKTLCIDSLTMVNEFLINKVQHQLKRKILEIQDWRLFRTDLLALISKMRNSGKTSIMTCHEEIKKERDGSVLRYDPAVSTSLTDYFGGFFTDMWRCTARPGAGDKVVFKLQTMSTPTSDLKNAYLMPATIENPTWEKINQYLKLT